MNVTKERGRAREVERKLLERWRERYRRIGKGAKTKIKQNIDKGETGKMG